MLVMSIIFALNIIWAVMNWKNEFNLIMAVWSQPGVSITAMMLAPLFLLLDLGITGTATSIFGFAGFYGSAMAIFMSNVLSLVFFVPKGNNKIILKNYNKSKRASR